jgi:hypothetical protein
MRALSTFRNLTGGRIPPLTRTALVCGLGLFLLTLLVFKPGAGGEAPAPALTNGVRLVAPGDARTESVVLLDTSAVYFPGKSAMGGAGKSEVGQPEDAPFAKSAPALQFDPAKPLSKDSTLQVPRQITPSPAKAVNLAESDPFVTFGAQGFKGAAIKSRAAFFEIYPFSGAKKPILSGEITHFSDLNGKNVAINKIHPPFDSVFEVILSVDSLGKTPLGATVRHSGSKSLDESIRLWAAGMDWAGRIPPGVYRLVVGP